MSLCNKHGSAIWFLCLFWDCGGLRLRFAGQVGYLIAGMKEVKEAQIGDTLYHQDQPVEALPGFKPAKAMVFAGKKYSHATWQIHQVY